MKKNWFFYVSTCIAPRPFKNERRFVSFFFRSVRWTCLSRTLTIAFSAAALPLACRIFGSNILKRRLNTIENHVGATEAAPHGLRKCEREGVEPRLKASLYDWSICWEIYFSLNLGFDKIIFLYWYFRHIMLALKYFLIYSTQWSCY